MKKLTIIISAIFLIINLSVAQDKTTKKYYNKGKRQFNKNNLQEAVDNYKIIAKQYPANSNYNFRVGLAYYYLPNMRDSSIFYMEQAATNVSENSKNNYKETTAPVEALFYLGKLHHQNYHFEKAISYLEQYKKVAKNEILLEDCERTIIACANGIDYLDKDRNLTVLEISGGINSKHNDHSPVLSGDMKTLIFTSRRKGTGGEIDEYDGEFFEDIYISHYENGSWTAPEGISPKINTNDHEASIGLSSDGNTLFIYKTSNGGDIYVSKFDGSDWSFPVPLGENINSEHRESHVSISLDEKTLYFSSDRPGGIGGMDLYVSELQEDGTWGKAKNLGRTVNSKRDDDGAYIQMNDSTIVFSSNRKESIGGFDIFYSKKDKNGNWQEPQNMGYPVNSPDDDFYYLESPDGTFALYATNQNGTKGDINLYTILLPQIDQKSVAVISGQILPESEEKKLGKIKISIINSESGDTTQTHFCDEKTGNYTFILPTGNQYTVVYESDGYLPYVQSMNIQSNADVRNTKGAIVLQPITLGQTGQNYSIGFEKGSSKLSYESEVKLAKVSETIKEYSTLTGELHIPNTDDPLTKRRTNTITEYLTSQNIDTAQLAIIKGYNSNGYELFVSDTALSNFKTKGWDIEFDPEENTVEQISKNKLSQVTYLLKKDPTLCVQIPIHENDPNSQNNANELFDYFTENKIDTSQIIVWKLPSSELAKSSNKKNIILTEKYYGAEALIKVVSQTTDECGIEAELKYDINFQFNSFETKDVNAINDAIATMECPNVEVIVAGHTDNIGTEQYNYMLGLKRADYIKNILLKNNINASKISIVSFGETKPIAPNTISGKDNPAGRELNRRVEIILKPIYE